MKIKIMGVFNILKPVDKYNLYKVADRSAQLIAIKNLYFKPSFASSFSFYDVYLFKDYLLANSLLTKLEFIDKFKFINYMKNLNSLTKVNFNMSKYIANDYRVYSLIFSNNINNLKIKWSKSILYSSTISLIDKFEFLLTPLKYTPEKSTKEKEKKELDFFEIVTSQEILNNQTNFILQPDSTKSTIHFDKYLLKDKMLYLKYLYQEEAGYKYYSPLEVDVNFIVNNIELITEEFLSLHINFENHTSMYLLIDINEYTIFLNNLKLSIDEITFYLNLANKFNNVIKNYIKSKKYPLEFFTFKKKNLIIEGEKLNITKMKNFEVKNSLIEFNIYTEYSFKTIIEFVELFLFKFEFIFTISIDKFLNLFYQGIENQLIYFNFYNLLVGELQNLKTSMTFTTLTYVVEFLEFLYLLGDIAGLTPDFFERSIYTLLNHITFKRLRLFRFNFYTRFKYFSFNNNVVKFNYSTYTNYMNKLLNPLILNRELNKKDLELCNRKTMRRVLYGENVTSNMNKLLLLFSDFKKFQYFQVKIKFFTKYVLKRKRKTTFFKLPFLQPSYQLYQFNLLNLNISKNSKYYVNLCCYNFSFLKYININKLKEILLFKDLIKQYMSKKNKKDLIRNIDLLKIEIKEIAIQMNKIRLAFLKSIISYNKKNKNRILLEQINFLNLAPGIIPLKHETSMSNIQTIGNEWIEQQKNLIVLNEKLQLQLELKKKNK
jgi:hypothetical protein